MIRSLKISVTVLALAFCAQSEAQVLDEEASTTPQSSIEPTNGGPAKLNNLTPLTPPNLTSSDCAKMLPNSLALKALSTIDPKSSNAKQQFAETLTQLHLPQAALAVADLPVFDKMISINEINAAMDNARERLKIYTAEAQQTQQSIYFFAQMIPKKQQAKSFSQNILAIEKQTMTSFIALLAWDQSVQNELKYYINCRSQSKAANEE